MTEISLADAQARVAQARKEIDQKIARALRGVGDVFNSDEYAAVFPGERPQVHEQIKGYCANNAFNLDPNPEA